MEALRKLEQTWKQCPQQALLLFIFVIGAIAGLCATAAVSRKRRVQREVLVEEVGGGATRSWNGWGMLKRELTGDRLPASPLWQRRILMGERCELPKFSGLILYDERGHPLRHSDKASTHQEIAAAAVTTTLKDFLVRREDSFSMRYETLEICNENVRL